MTAGVVVLGCAAVLLAVPRDCGPSRSGMFCDSVRLDTTQVIDSRRVLPGPGYYARQAATATRFYNEETPCGAR